jgi:diguanylate cyclase (GGDEF)-like protein/PAS domain S-box-containing protein
LKKRYINILIPVTILILCFIFSSINIYADTDAGTSLNNILSFERRLGDSPVIDNKFIWINDDKSEGWENFIFPDRPDSSDRKKIIWFRFKISKEQIKDPTLYIRFSQMACVAYYAGEEIYRFKEIDLDNKNRTPGTKLHLIKLPDKLNSEYIYFRTFSPFPGYAGTVNDVYYGSYGEIRSYLFKNHITIFTMSFFFIVLGLFLSVLYFSRRTKLTGALSLGLGVFFLGIWLFTESIISFSILEWPVGMLYISYTGLYLAPPGFIYFIYYVLKPPFGKIIKASSFSFIIVFIIIAILELTGLLSMIRTVIVQHILLVLCLIFIIFSIILCIIRGNKSGWVFLIGFISIGLTSVHDMLILSYKTPKWLLPNNIAHWGAFIFVLCMVYLLSRSFIVVYEKLKKYSDERDMNYKILVESVQEGIAILDSNFNLAYANPGLSNIFNLPSEEIIGKPIFDFISDEEYMKKFKSSKNNDFKDEVSISTDESSKKYLSVSHTPKFIKDKYNGAFMTFIDITENKNAEKRIKNQAYRDSMTGLFNRRYFEEETEKINSNLKDLYPISCIAIDLDGLKITNDTFGHKIGDELLIKSAQIILSCFRSTDLVARVGGDEFCVILPNTDIKKAQEKKALLLQNIAAYNYEKPTVEISMSVGLSTSGSVKEDLFSIYKRADDMMYEYKLSQSSSTKGKVVDMLLHALSERDYVAEGHVERLVFLAEKMASELNLSDTETRNFILLAKIHDLGKIGMPDDILFKKEKLTKKEYEKMKEHSVIGHNIANRSKGLSNISKLILHHHERWDGNGYPDGLKGTAIPVECRVLNIIDSYDAMTNLRPYHDGISKEDALEEIEKNSGKQFDPDIAKSFLTLMRK